MENFTPKQLEILKYLCKGYTNNKIAEELFVSIHTVKAHIGSMLKKSGADNRTLLVYMAAKADLV